MADLADRDRVERQRVRLGDLRCDVDSAPGEPHDDAASPTALAQVHGEPPACVGPVLEEPLPHVEHLVP